MYVAPKLQGGSDLLLGPSLLPLTPGCLHILMDVCQQLVLPNQIWVCLSDVQQSPSADTRLWWRKVQCLLKGAKQANGRQASDPLPLGLWVKVFLKGKNKEVEVNHGLVTFLWHFLIIGVRMSLVYDLRPSGPWLGGLLAHLVLEKQPEFVHWWWWLQQQF